MQRRHIRTAGWCILQLPGHARQWQRGKDPNPRRVGRQLPWSAAVISGTSAPLSIMSSLASSPLTTSSQALCSAGEEEE